MRWWNRLVWNSEAGKPTQVEKRDMSWWGMGMDPPVTSVAAGVSVTPTNALGLSAVYACVRLISDAIATLPVDAYLQLGPDTRKPTDVPSWITNPNGDPWVGKIELFNQVMTSFLLRGDAYILTPRADGEVMGLVVLDPGQVTPRDDRPTYTASWQSPTTGQYFSQELDRSELLHLRAMMLPGAKTGCSPITYCRESLGVGLATQKFGGAFFGNGAWPGLVAEVPGQMSEVGQKALASFFESRHKGAQNAHKVGVLTEGAKLNKLQITPEDSQFIETRRFEVSDVARMFGVPPHLIGDASNSTSWGSGLAQQDTAFGQYGLRPWVERIDAGMTALWRSEGGPENGFIKLNLDGRLRGSLKERYEAYEIGIRSGWLLKSEVRALEDLPPVGGIDDQPQIPANDQEDEGS